jgi:hypothetical protein
MAYSEFCCKAGGSNLNAGSRNGTSEPGTSPDFQYASGSWVASTGVFTVASGNPVTDGVSVGDFASVYVDGSTRTGFVGRVTAVTSTTITVSLTDRAGTAPVDGTSNRTLRIGGAWLGPVNVIGAEAWPLIVDCSNLRRSTLENCRVNFKNDQTYRITSQATLANATGFISFAGYASTYGDLGKIILQGIGTGAAHTILAAGGGSTLLHGVIFENNGSSSAAPLVNGLTSTFVNCVFRNSRQNGASGNGGARFIECEAYNNLGNGFGAAGEHYRCSSHDNTGSGFLGAVNNFRFVNCVSYRNTSHGFQAGTNATQGPYFVSNCDAYANGGSGFLFGTFNERSLVFVENCNAVDNGTWGFNATTTTGSYLLFFRNCGVGSGTMANVSGNFNFTDPKFHVEIVGTVTYPTDATPWVDPNNGNFQINLPQARQAGWGTIPQEVLVDIVGNPPIGAAVGVISGGSSGLLSQGFVF